MAERRNNGGGARLFCRAVSVDKAPKTFLLILIDCVFAFFASPILRSLHPALGAPAKYKLLPDPAMTESPLLSIVVAGDLSFNFGERIKPASPFIKSAVRLVSLARVTHCASKEVHFAAG
ncbi:MAG: hypothetical protein LBT81_06110 [Helicobacteraceae bacterium]|jgi:hypothetical protein|nr:hypothetical protein [Helicobacteraceae bacterium]